MFSIFLKSLIIGYSGAVMPGSMLTYTIDKSLKNGSKSGFFISLGHALLEMFLVIIIFIGAGKYLSENVVKIAISLLGGLVLGYMGLSMIKDTCKSKISLTAPKSVNDKQGNMFFAGMALSITNPYFLVWWAVVGLSLIVSAYNAFGIVGIAVFYIGHILSDITWFSFVSLLVSKTRQLISIKTYKIITVILGLFLFGFGINFVIYSIKLLSIYN
jgi:threonine/homoserine/homoserine lactone efflux protein